MDDYFLIEYIFSLILMSHLYSWGTNKQEGTFVLASNDQKYFYNVFKIEINIEFTLTHFY